MRGALRRPCAARRRRRAAGDATAACSARSAPHLHPTFAPGVRGPTPAGGPSQPRTEPIPVVVLGRYTDPVGVACSPTSRDCGQAFAVERVVWVAGEPWGVTLSVDAAMDVDPNIPEIRGDRRGRRRTRSARVPWRCASAVVRPDMLGCRRSRRRRRAPGPPARRPAPAGHLFCGLVFQFDASQPLYGRDPTIGWVVVDSITGEVLARGGPRLARPGRLQVPSRAPTP